MNTPNPTRKVIKESAKVDLQAWLTGVKPRTKKVRISSEPDMEDELDELAEQIGELANKLDGFDGDESEVGGIADDDPLDTVRAEHAALLARHREMWADYESTLETFVVREYREADPPAARAAVEAAGDTWNDKTATWGLFAEQLISHDIAYTQVGGFIEAIGLSQWAKFPAAMNALASKRKEPAAPLSPRP